MCFKSMSMSSGDGEVVEIGTWVRFLFIFSIFIGKLKKKDKC